MNTICRVNSVFLSLYLLKYFKMPVNSSDLEFLKPVDWTSHRLDLIDQRFGTLAFCPRWLVQERLDRVAVAKVVIVCSLGGMEGRQRSTSNRF